MVADSKLTGILLPADIHANRPSATAVVGGALFPCTTHSLIYQSNGATWSTWATLGSSSTGTLTTVEEVDGSPTDSAVTKLVLPNGTVSIVGHVATYTPAGGGGGGSGPLSFLYAATITR